MRLNRVRTIKCGRYQSPIITLLGDSNITHEAGPEYVDAGRNGMIPWMAMVPPMPTAR